MGLDDTELGTGEEKNLSSRIDNLDRLVTQAESSLIKSDDPEEIAKYLFDRNYYMLARWQLETLAMRRSGDAEDASEANQDRVIFYRQQHDAIQSGDWKATKEDFISLEGLAETLPETAVDFGLPPTFSFNGVQIFSPEVDVELREKTWLELIKSKMSLIPDQSDPFVPTNLAELQAKSLGLEQ